MNLYEWIFTLGLFLPAGFLVNTPPPTPQSLYLSTNTGSDWVAFSEGIPEGELGNQLFDLDGELFLITSKNRLYRLPPGDCVWQPTGMDKFQQDDLFYTSLTGQGDELVAATLQKGIFLSYDRGRNWHRPVFNIPNPEVMCLTFFEDKLYAGTSRGIYISYDGGSTWHKGPGEHFPVYNLFPIDGELLVARQNGLGAVTKEGINWSATQTKTAVLQLLEEQETVYATTASAELYRRETSGEWTEITGHNATLFENDLRRRLRPRLPVTLPDSYSTRIHSTAYGWLALVRSGC